MIYHLVCWDLPLVLLLEVHLAVKVKALWTWKNRKLESLKMEEKEAETAIEIGIEGTEIGMEIEGQVEDGRIEMTGEIEDEMVIEVEMIEEGRPDLEERTIGHRRDSRWGRDDDRRDRNRRDGRRDDQDVGDDVSSRPQSMAEGEAGSVSLLEKLDPQVNLQAL